MTRTISRAGIWSLFVVYGVWGSSFLAIRLAVHGEGALAPYTLAAIRTGIAGCLLLVFSIWRGYRMCLSRRQAFEILLTGVLLWVGGHALVIWAERYVASGLAALLFATSPLWGALIESLSQRRFLRPMQIIVIICGFGGVAMVATNDRALTLQSVDAWPVLALIASAFFWALGTRVSSRELVWLPATVASGYQLLVAGVVSSVIAVSMGEEWRVPSSTAVLASIYLVVFGTLIAYYAYTLAMRGLPYAWVMSFAYVNPVIAVVLGILILGEPFSLRACVGMIVVILAVYLTFVFDGKSQA